MSQLSTGSGSHDKNDSAKPLSAPSLTVPGGSVDQQGGNQGLEGGEGSLDQKKGLAEGLQGETGEQEHAGSGFDAGVQGGSTKSGGGTTLDA